MEAEAGFGAEEVVHCALTYERTVILLFEQASHTTLAILSADAAVQSRLFTSTNRIHMCALDPSLS